MQADEPKHGAYGFRLSHESLGAVFQDLVPLDGDAPVVTLAWRHACAAVTFDAVDGERASMGTRGASAFHVEREPPSITFDVGFVPPPDALIHPIATVPLAVLARWRGDVTLHGGAFAAGDRAWALIGERHAGKSTMLGLLASRGHPVVADDLLVVREGIVWSGPRCVDLREDAAAQLGPTRDLGSFGARRRLRLSSPPAPARLPLAGFFLLDWHAGSEVIVERLPLAARVRALYGLEYAALVGPADPRDILDLSALPAWHLRRPQSWSAGEVAADRLLAVAGA